ncbi:MAG: hypothetical protein IH889_11200 [Planctomycetes bacterium]|nr:hypothetical protein [Planctomycetota bacterium]
MRGPVTAKIGLVLCRIVVPLWVLSGAVFKLIERSPRTLPRETILNVADGLGLHLYGLLATLIALEFLAIAVMVFLGRFARAMALFMLTAFCLILLGELVGGNFTDCGCLGANSPPPWVMLAIDGALLAGVLLFKPTRGTPTARVSRWPVVTALVVILAGFGTSFSLVIPAGRAPETPNVNGPVPPNGPRVNPAPATLPGYWFASEVESWIGKPWQEIDLFRYMRKWPKEMDSAKRYVVFYSRTCDHCEEMFLYDLTDPALGSMVTAVEVPQSKSVLTSSDAWPMPATECELLALPLGCDWIITAPLTITVENGIVTCATEGDHIQCMGLAD